MGMGGKVQLAEPGRDVANPPDNRHRPLTGADPDDDEERATAKGQYVLIVEDDPDVRESMELLLNMHGHRVFTATDGQAALMLLENQSRRPCLLLLDLMMPGMNGFELRSRMKADPDLARIPVVVITGAGVLADARADELAAPVLKKPIEFKALLDTVNRFCPRRPRSH